MRRLSERDHSKKELTDKLKRWYTPEAIQEAIAKIESYGYFKPETEMTKLWTQSLHRKGRGYFRIRHEMKKRGLPPPEMDYEEEMQACRKAFTKKFGETRLTSKEERFKAIRYLTSRGFDSDTIRKVIGAQ